MSLSTNDSILGLGPGKSWVEKYFSPTVINVPESTTGATVQDSYTVPGGLLGESSKIKVTVYVGNVVGGTITARIYIDGVSTFVRNIAAGSFCVFQPELWNVNSLTSQRAFPNIWYPNAIPVETQITASVDTAQDFDIDVRCITDVGETCSIYYFSVEYMK